MHSTEKTVFSTNDAVTTRSICGKKKKNFNSYPMPIKINSKHITDLKIKPKTIKLTGKNK